MRTLETPMATTEALGAASPTGDARTRPADRVRRDHARLLDRSIVYGALTGAILLTYAGSVVLFQALLPGDIPYAIALLSTGAAALVALPLRDQLQRVVDQVMYGDRRDPYRAITRLGTQLEASVGPDDVPTVVVETVAQALRLPYVAVELRSEAGPSVSAVHGRPPHGIPDAELLRLALVHQGLPIGTLVLAPRSPGEAFNEADLRLLADLGRQAGPAIQAARLTADLRRSRLHLVTAREEERRRLRRDLHDGVGPTLAGTLMKMEAARTRLAEHPEEAERVLVDLAAGTRRVIDEVRRVTYDLRPPALDELGLVGALREQAAGFAGARATPLRIEIQVAGDLPALSAAVEVAAYRIALEALTNVVRHSGAASASVRLGVEGGELVLEVRDDGHGLAGGGSPGVGHRSMRERAEELGGSLDLGGAPGAGTFARATLPIHAPSDG
jgi:signal transduction histidine kinase